MKVLVTGATGKVGSRLIPRLSAKGMNIRILVRDESNVQHLKELGVEIAVGDINIPETLPSAVKDIHTIIHTAAYFRNMHDTEGIMKTNCNGTMSLAGAAVKAGVKRFVFSSTGLVYGSDIPHPADEDDPCTAEGAYAYPASKLAAENDLLELNTTGKLDVRIVRLGFVYGDGDSHLADYPSLFPLVKAHPGSRTHLVHHLDVAQALFLLSKTDGINGEIFNLADDAPVTYYEIAKILNRRDTAFNYRYDSPGNPFGSVMDTTKIRRMIGFRPLVPTLYQAMDLDIL